MAETTILLTQGDLARLLDISRQRISQLVFEGKIEPPAYLVSRSQGWTHKQLERIINQRRATGQKVSSKCPHCQQLLR